MADFSAPHQPAVHNPIHSPTAHPQEQKMVPTPHLAPRPNQAGHAAEPAAEALQALEQQWVLSDALFATHVPDDAAHDSPIHLRNPYIFYMGHLPSFASTRLLAPLAAAPSPALDTLFLRGRDPDVDGPDPGLLRRAWPTLRELCAYRDDVRAAVRAQARAGCASPRVLRVVAEHEAMHVETLYYMLSQNRKALYMKAGVGSGATAIKAAAAAPTARPAFEWLPVAAGAVSLGRDLSDPGAKFGWDNEGIVHTVPVQPFHVAKYAVSVADFMRFVAAGGYADPQWWAPDDWAWVRREGLRCPEGWVLDGGGNLERVCTGVGPGASEDAAAALPEDFTEWPVSASLAEARAFAKWVGARLPSEAEWVRAAYGTGVGADYGAPGGACVESAAPQSVFAGPAAWCGAVVMVGNGWELTTSVLARFEGFAEMEEYPEYTADFFDDKHFVLKGASWATPRLIVRRSFRNYYQARYPYVFSKVRLVRDD